MISLTHQFAAWCRSKPADETYNYTDAKNCAFAQFAREMGIPDPVRDSSLAESRGDVPLLPPALEIPLVDSSTFGELARRLDRQIAKQARP